MSIGDFIDSVDSTLANVAGDNTVSGDFTRDGFLVSSTPSADGNGLPSSKVPYGRKPAVQKRQIMHWFVPEFGVIQMYINPSNVTYSFSKHITPTRTKGGFVIQYWGEDLTNLSINGTTGSSGVEGMNVLYEIYRAEQLSFDAAGLTMAANSQVSGFADAIGGVASSIFGSGSDVGNIVGGALGEVLGLDPAAGNFLPQDVPSLGSLAIGVELYWSGWVFRGYFNSCVITESTQHLGMFNYDIKFTVTQRRGYRTNFMPWHRSATSGASNNGPNGVPLTFAPYVSSSSPPIINPVSTGINSKDVTPQYFPIASGK